MGLNIKQFTEATELHYEQKQSVFWGDYNGFPIALSYNAQRNYFVLALCARCPEGADINTALKEWERGCQGISQSVYERNMIRCIISIAGMHGNDKVIQNLTAITSFARMQGMIPCCSNCGDTSYYAPHMVNENLVMLFCDPCAARVEQSFAETRSEEDAHKPKAWGVALGILIGAVVLFVITYLLYQMGYMAYISGYAGLLAALFAVKKFAGKLNAPVAILAAVVCMAVAYVTPCFAMSQDLAKYIREEYIPGMEADGFDVASLEDFSKALDEGLATLSEAELQETFGSSRAELEDTQIIVAESISLMTDYQTTGAWFQDLWKVTDYEVFSDTDIKGELIKNILWGVLSVLVGAILTIPGMVRSAKDRYHIRRMA